MLNSPFKFLDAYTKEDKDIFFGRDQEIEELYQRVFESKVLLVCGISGTGKSSLIQCGLANKFQESDWLPVNIRRGRNMLESLVTELQKYSVSPPSSLTDSSGLLPPGGDKSAIRSPQSAEKELFHKQIVKVIRSIYLDHFKPVYLIFDQFEELFIFGNREERKEFITEIKKILDSDVQCKIIFVMREEYLASAIEFEREIPTILTNRMRVERMTWANAKEAIEGPCQVAGIELEKGFAEAALDKLNPESSEVELTYLQVMLDKVFKIASSNFQHSTSNVQHSKERKSTDIQFIKSYLEEVGDVSDLLGSFLEDQIRKLEEPDTGLVILKSFVSIKGTKRQVTLEDVTEFVHTLGKEIAEDELKDLVIRFVNLRILRGKDESGRYELRHDSLALKIYEKITLVEKELLEVRQFIENAYINYERRGIPLSQEDLAYISTYENRLYLKGDLDDFVQNCKQIIVEKKRSFNRILRISAIGFLLVISAVIFYYIRSTSSIKSRRLVQEASLQLHFSPGLSFTTALKAYEQDSTSSLAVKAIFDAFYGLLAESYFTDSLGEVHDPMKDIFNFTPCESKIRFAKFSEDGEFIYGYLEDNTVKVWKKNGSEIFSEKAKDTTLLAVNFAPDNQHISAVFSDSTAFIWKINGELTCSVDVYYEPLNPAYVVSFSPTLDLFSNVATNNCIQLRDFAGNLLYELQGHTAPVNEAVFSPNGEFMASASKDSLVIIWRLDSVSGRFDRFRDLDRFQNVVWSVEFSNGSDYLLCASTDTGDWPGVSRLYNFNRKGYYKGRAVYDTSFFDQYDLWFIDMVTGKAVSARFNENNSAIIFRSQNDKKPWLSENMEAWSDTDYFAQVIFPAPESRWKLMKENRNIKNYPVTIKEVYPYGGLDMSVNGYLASNILGMNETIIFHWDHIPLRSFPGTQPLFSPDGKYLLCLSERMIHMYPACEKEMIRLVSQESIFGDLDAPLRHWLHFHTKDN